MCHQRADSSFLYKKALLATLRSRALTPSKMVLREAGILRNLLNKNIVIKAKFHPD
ncbi:hypothetical protein [Streptococcus equinus]|uniref:hypothetical protein n=1 Tax=Streptococcus equinus TaxID=1335 RepID=UPI001642686A|nr:MULTISPECIES: hypothetical protein [Streptococcus]